MKTVFFKLIFIILTVTAGITSCSKPEDRIYLMRYPEPPTVVTNDPEDVSINAAYLSGKIIATGSGNISRSGINIYPADSPVFPGTFPAPAFNDYRYSNNSSDVYFSVLVRNLKPNSTYHYRAFASNDAGTSFGELKILVTAFDSVSYKKGSE